MAETPTMIDEAAVAKYQMALPLSCHRTACTRPFQGDAPIQRSNWHANHSSGKCANLMPAVVEVEVQ